MIYPKLLQNLIDYLKKLPGIGEKSGERMALALIKMSADEINDLSNCLILAKKGLKLSEIDRSFHANFSMEFCEK